MTELRAAVRARMWCAAAWRSCRETDDLPQVDDCSPAEIRGPQGAMNWPPRLGTMS
jgi:hypothetical protein